MSEEEMITTYKEFEETIKNGERKLVKGMGRLQAYQGLRYIELLCENDKYYSEELEDSFVGIVSYINSIEKENQQLKEQLTNASNNYTKYIQERDKVIEEVREYINNYDVFKEFSFPIMKRHEENQVKSSIKYEFDMSIKKDVLHILDKAKGEDNG